MLVSDELAARRGQSDISDRWLGLIRVSQRSSKTDLRKIWDGSHK